MLETLFEELFRPSAEDIIPFSISPFSSKVQFLIIGSEKKDQEKRFAGGGFED